MKRTNGLLVSRVTGAVLIGFGLSLAAGAVGAQDFEMPPTLRASEILPAYRRFKPQRFARPFVPAPGWRRSSTELGNETGDQDRHVEQSYDSLQRRP